MPSPLVPRGIVSPGLTTTGPITVNEYFLAGSEPERFQDRVTSPHQIAVLYGIR
jgi:hypothetical protein